MTHGWWLNQRFHCSFKSGMDVSYVMLETRPDVGETLPQSFSFSLPILFLSMLGQSLQFCSG